VTSFQQSYDNPCWRGSDSSFAYNVDRSSSVAAALQKTCRPDVEEDVRSLTRRNAF
jgi:hypothetical protein